ncbi:hypothetical protein U8V72_11410 [Priestia filamentosa]|uniref:hypothetical protein n=1 Tax=Priestia filamentosa TaxID=1402861 RepID=UPI00397B7113
MELQSKSCPKCRGKFKLMKKPYVIKTRDERRRLVRIENLPYLECTICDYEEITSTGEKLIENVQDMIKVGMEQLVRIEESQLQSISENPVSNVIRKFIG